jgi:hypothetical protein
MVSSRPEGEGEVAPIRGDKAMRKERVRTKRGGGKGQDKDRLKRSRSLGRRYIKAARRGRAQGYHYYVGAVNGGSTTGEREEKNRGCMGGKHS